MDPTSEELVNRRISDWLRQSRVRAGKYGCVVNLTHQEVFDILKLYDGKCAYCDQPATVIDLAFPIKDKAPLVAANILPACQLCRDNKKHRSVFDFFRAGYIDKVRLHSVIPKMIVERHGHLIRDFMRTSLKGA